MIARPFDPLVLLMSFGRPLPKSDSFGEEFSSLLEMEEVERRFVLDLDFRLLLF